MKADSEFTAEQKQYLAGFFEGAKQRSMLPSLGRTPEGMYTAETDDPEVETVYGTPLEDLCKEELIKHEKNGLDCYEDILRSASENKMPEGADVFRFKFYGLFNVAPAQEKLMLRCRIPGGLLRSAQFDGLALMAEELAGGYAHITTRANIQLREIAPKDAATALERLVDMGLTSRGAGADNLRNVTGSPTAGFDPEELYDVRPLARAMHHLILNTREFYGLPRKFNIAFDGGGEISTCADTNDIAFYAVRVGEGASVPPGVYFRVQLAGITGHKQFAKDCGILVEPRHCMAVAAAMIRVFVENGDRTNRKKARLKYLIDKWGEEKFVGEAESKLAFPLVRYDLAQCQQRGPARRHGHIGIYPQFQQGLCYLGVRIPVGRMLPGQMRDLADLARRYGRGELRLTVWQSLLIPHVARENAEELASCIESVGFSCKEDPLRGGLVACTGNFGCKYASADTKRHAVELGDYLSENVPMDDPVNLHLTGCPHSCAQHYVGDIGMQAVKVKVGGESVEGYNIVLGGGVDDEQGIAKEVFRAVPFSETKTLLAGLLRAYLETRSAGERFVDFARSRSPEKLAALCAGEATAV